MAAMTRSSVAMIIAAAATSIDILTGLHLLSWTAPTVIVVLPSASPPFLLTYRGASRQQRLRPALAALQMDSSLFGLLPAELVPVILSFLIPYDKLVVLPRLSTSFRGYLTPAAFKSDLLILSPALLDRLIASVSLHSLVSLVPSLSLSAPQAASRPMPPSLLPQLLPFISPHITDSFLLSSISSQVESAPASALCFSLFAFLSYCPPALVRLSSLRLQLTDAQALVHLSPLSFPSLTSLTLGGLVLDHNSLAPLLTLPALQRLDLSRSVYTHTAQHPFSSLLLTSGAATYLTALSVPDRPFWGKLDSVVAVIGRKDRRATLREGRRADGGGLRHLSPCGHVSAADFAALAAMPSLQSLVLDGCWFFAADFLAFAAELETATADSGAAAAASSSSLPFPRLRRFIARHYDIQHNGGIELPAGTDLPALVTSSLCSFLRVLPNLQTLLLTLPPYACIDAQLSSALTFLPSLRRLHLSTCSFTPRSARILPCAFSPLPPGCFHVLRELQLNAVGATDAAVGALVRAAPSLEVLQCIGCWELTGAVWRHCGRGEGGSRLRRMALDECENVRLLAEPMLGGDEEEDAAAEDEPQVVLGAMAELLVSLCCHSLQMDADGLRELLRLMPGLRRVSLQARWLGLGDVLLLCSLPRLESLSLGRHSEGAAELLHSALYCEREKEARDSVYSREKRKTQRMEEEEEDDGSEQDEEEVEARRKLWRWRFRDEQSKAAFAAALHSRLGQEADDAATERLLMQAGVPERTVRSAGKEEAEEMDGSGAGAAVVQTATSAATTASESSARSPSDAPASRAVSRWQRFVSCLLCGEAVEDLR